MKKVIIIGCCGCGKTTLARALAKALSLPLVHLDQLGWRDNWQPVSREEFEVQLRRELAKSAWIIDGNYNHTLPLRLGCCDTVIFMDYPRRICLLGVIRRMVMSYGKAVRTWGETAPSGLTCRF